MAITQSEAYFRLADQDKDGVVGGGEAVQFFLKSGLPQEVLGQIWELASGGGASLNNFQFQTALRLVSLAQVHNGVLPPNETRVVAMGGGPQLPPPKLAGVDGVTTVPPTFAPPRPAGFTPQPTGGSGYVQQPTGGMYAPQMTGAGYAPQMTGAPGYRPQMTGPAGYAPQATGPGYAPQMTGGYRPQMTGPVPGYAPPPTGAGYTPQVTGGYPPASPQDMQRYQGMFMQLDADRDGVVKGSECFGFFMHWGLDKAVLKAIWDVVAGNSGALEGPQFVAAVYLMDCAKRGMPVPRQLPPGPFPIVVAGMPGMAAGATGAAPVAAGATGAAPVAGAAAGAAVAAGVTGGPLAEDEWSLASQFGRQGMVKAVEEKYSGEVRLPELPKKMQYVPAAAPKPAEQASAVPSLDATISSTLQPAEQQRLTAAQEEAARKEKELRDSEAQAAAAKARAEAYQAALAELALFKSRTDVALLQAQEHQRRLANEADDYEHRYAVAHKSAQAQFESNSSIREHIQALLARKQEAANRLELLQQELEMLSNLNPEEVRRLEQEVAALVAAMTDAESQKAALELKLEGGKKQKELLRQRIQDLELAAASEAQIGKVAAEVEDVAQQVATTQQELPDREAVGSLLGRAAVAYRALYTSAQAHGMDIPYEANLNNVGGLVWMEQLLAGAADWLDDDATPQDRGYQVVNALPDLEGIPPALLKPPPQERAQPMRAQPDKESAAGEAAGGDADAAKEAGTPRGGATPKAAAAAAVAPAAAADSAGDGAGAKQPGSANSSQGGRLGSRDPSGGGGDGASDGGAALAAGAAVGAAAGVAALAASSAAGSHSDGGAALMEPKMDVAPHMGVVREHADVAVRAAEPVAAAMPAVEGVGAADSFEDDAAFGDAIVAANGSSSIQEQPSLDMALSNASSTGFAAVNPLAGDADDLTEATAAVDVSGGSGSGAGLGGGFDAGFEDNAF